MTNGPDRRRRGFTVRLALSIAAAGLLATQPSSAGPNVGLLMPLAPGGKPDAELDTAREIARKVAEATPFTPAGSKDMALDRFAAVWCHGGGEAGGLDREVVAALSNHVASGHGLLLSGSAVTLVNALGLENVRPTPVTFGDDRAQAGLVPVLAGHPAFRGLDTDRGSVWLSNAVYPAFAGLPLAARPPDAAVLARSAGAPENPLVEYRLGAGRVVACGWRLSPLYFHAPRGPRDRFERLAGNLLAYLGDPARWTPLPPPAAAAPDAARIPESEWEALALALEDLRGTFGNRYPRAAEFLGRLAALRKAREAVVSKTDREGVADGFRRLRDEALLANPLLDFERLLLVRRDARKPGLPMNYQSNSSLPPAGYTNDLACLSPVRPGGALTTLHRPEGGRFVGDVRLHFDADRLLFSSPRADGRWRVHEIRADGAGLRTLPMIDEPDVDNYDACYLPGGRIVFTSTAPFTGVPCVRGSAHVANLYLQEPDGRIRQLTFEQDHDWCPTPLPNGRVLYLRWEYTDLPHAFSRILFHMNPDGTEQMEYYGSNSYWPASMFYAKPLPGQPTKFVAIVGGHHEQARVGDLVIFDTARGRFEADGAVQRIPGRGRPVEPIMLDLPVAQTWPKFLHPHPLSDKYFLVSCQPAAGASWGIYLADVFDNLVLLREEPGVALLEPVPLRRTDTPPVVADKSDPARGDAEVLLTDVYAGPGLKGVPRGTIKALRIVGYHFAYQGIGGEPDAPGMDGPWDVKRVIGTVPVREDGSARFRVPACTPLALQPLDADGAAVQLMRSWFTAMPGEVVSCAGCHEPQNSTPSLRPVSAALRPADAVRPWYGPARGFDFRREVQPVLDRSCTGCHDGKPRADGKAVPDLTDRPPAPLQDNPNAYNLASKFTPSYYVLRRLVRTPTREGDMHLLPPWEYHAGTTRLVQMLRKGHHGAVLDAAAWDRILTWIDLGAPAHGTWTDVVGRERVQRQAERRREMRRRYAGTDEDPEAVFPPARLPPLPPAPAAVSEVRKSVDAAPAAAGWPFDASEARRRQAAGGRAVTDSVLLAPGIPLEMALVPEGEFVMGQPDGGDDERPCGRVAVPRAFWMGRFEVSNEQFALFDPAHDSGLEPGDYIQFSPGERGWSLARPRQPVVRVSWRAAAAFCAWLSAKTGRRFRLPTEAEWEYACRAGSAAPMGHGAADADFSRRANLSDATHRAIDPFGWSGRPLVIPPWRPADARFDDHARVSAPVGSYEPNPWGLHDMHGNVAEWTSSACRPYPYDPADGRERLPPAGPVTVRGGSWYDPPARARCAFRQGYLPDQGVYDVGFRVVCETAERR